VEARLLADGVATPAGLDALGTAMGGASSVVWADLDHEDEAAMAHLRDRCGYHPTALDDCHDRTPVPKVHVYEDHLFVAGNGLVRAADGDLHFLPLKVFVDPSRIVTVLGPTHDAVDRASCLQHAQSIRRRLDEGIFRPGSAMEIGHAVMVGMLRSQETLLARLAGEVSQLERRVMQCHPTKNEALLEEVFALRHDLQTLRTNAAQNREVFARLMEVRGLPEDAIALLEDLFHGFDHLKTTTDLEREYLQEVLEVFQTRIANELNVFVRQLTAWGAIGIAGTLIAGVYGMNFTHMPELDWRLGYPMALGMMVVAGLVLAWIFKRRGWL